MNGRFLCTMLQQMKLVKGARQMTVFCSTEGTVFVSLEALILS